MLSPPLLETSQANTSRSTGCLTAWPTKYSWGKEKGCGGEGTHSLHSDCGFNSSVSLRIKGKMQVRKIPSPLVPFQSHGWQSSLPRVRGIRDAGFAENFLCKSEEKTCSPEVCFCAEGLYSFLKYMNQLQRLQATWGKKKHTSYFCLVLVLYNYYINCGWSKHSLKRNYLSLAFVAVWWDLTGFLCLQLYFPFLFHAWFRSLSSPPPPTPPPFCMLVISNM